MPTPWGQTDAEIAEKLFTSVSTAGTHLDQIRDKSGCRRADLASRRGHRRARGLLHRLRDPAVGKPGRMYVFPRPESGKLTLTGSFPNLPSSLDFTIEFDQRFQGAGGYNILFHSEKTSNHARYLIAVQHVAATG